MTDTELIKQKIDIIDLISEYVSLKKTGANFKGLCPFHNEKTPSFTVSPERQIWHCFGGCQDGGDIFKFVMRAESFEFPEALKMLAQRAGVTLSSFQQTKTGEIKDRIHAANSLASEYYQFILTSHPIGKPAKDYLSNRKINDSSIKLFALGYAPNSWDSLINFMTKKGFTFAELEIAGLVSKSTSGKYFDRFRGRLMFTLADQHKNIVGFAGRSLNPDVKEAKYINTAETQVYIKGNVLYGLNVTKDEIKKSNSAVVVEGEIDLIQSYQSGIRNIVAIKGSALTEGQVQLLKRYTQNISLALDSDFAGDAAAHRGILIADSAGFDIKVIVFHEAKDPDELIKLDPSLWRKAVEKAAPFYDFIIDSALEKYDVKTAFGAKSIVADTAKFLQPIENSVVKNHYLKKLAEKLGIPVEILEDQMIKEYRKLSWQKTSKISSDQPINDIPKSREITLSRYLLSLLLQSDKPQDYLLLFKDRLESEDFPEPATKKIYEKLVDFAQTVPLFSMPVFMQSLPDEFMKLIDELCLTDISIDINDDQLVLEEVTKAIWELKELTLKKKLKDITTKIKDAQESDQAKFQQDLQETNNELYDLLAEKKLIFSAEKND